MVWVRLSIGFGKHIVYLIIRVFSGIYLDIGISRVHPYGIYYMECLIESTLEWSRGSVWTIPGVTRTVKLCRPPPNLESLCRTKHLDDFHAVNRINLLLKKIDLQVPRSLLLRLSTRISQIFGSLIPFSLVLVESAE